MTQLLAFLFYGITTFFSLEAFTSDKGLSAEHQSAFMEIFCKTKLVSDLAPLMKEKLILMRSKVSPATLEKEQKRLDKLWSKCRDKYKAILNEAAPSARTSHLEITYFQEQAKLAWEQAQKTCPTNLGGLSELYAIELAERWYQDLKSGALKYKSY